MSMLQMWAGLECTLNRVGDRYVNQNDKNGHSTRMSDLHLFSDLGVKKVRYPCLWELVAPESADQMDWCWLDERLGEIKKIGISPIAGFLHHGSGPKYTSLIDPEFPEKLANYAKAFAERYPWVEDYTPINEINTTARFSCLYGHWYPHHKCDHSYLKAVIHQCKATVLAMREIRKINPKAKLIQTDDLGRIESTEALRYQRDFENERRWISYDMLCGKINSKHPLYDYLLQCEITAEELTWFEENPCPPDVIGINHYHLSNRFLDDQLDLYPDWLHGGNGRHRYADVGAIDTGRTEPTRPAELILETWERYHLPVAVTEVHVYGGREAQMRWLKEVWEAALNARSQGANVVAITAWSLLGTYDWNTLCTSCNMFYESGVFDLRTKDGVPRPTALTKMIKDLASKGETQSPVLEDEGCWRTPRRILFAAQEGSFSNLSRKSRPILITGATGTLGQAFARVCGSRNINYKLLKRSDMDIASIDSVRKVVQETNPWAIINTAGFVRVDDAEEQRDICFRENVTGPVNLAQVCEEIQIPFVTFSSDLVFNGESDQAYVESHIKNPLNVYGQSKSECEEKVLSLHPNSLVIRTSSFFGPWDNYNFLTTTLRDLLQRKEVYALHDVRVSPTYVPDLVETTLDLLIDGESGLLHLTNQGSLSWSDLAKMVASKKNIESSLIIEKSIDDLELKARRPKNSTLESERWNILPDLESSVNRYLSQVDL